MFKILLFYYMAKIGSQVQKCTNCMKNWKKNDLEFQITPVARASISWARLNLNNQWQLTQVSAHRTLFMPHLQPPVVSPLLPGPQRKPYVAQQSSVWHTEHSMASHPSILAAVTLQLDQSISRTQHSLQKV